jgi:hypothetical protein
MSVAVALARGQPAPATLPGPVGAAWRGLDRCERLLAEHLAEAVQRFGAAVLGLVDVPTMQVGVGALSPPQLRVAAALIWARHVEEAGLLPFVEALAEGVVKGTVLLPIREGASTLVRYWRGRDQRFGPAERRELYRRILGDGADPITDPAAGQFAALVDALSAIGRTPPDRAVHHLLARVNVIGRDLGGMLSERCAGMAGYAARDIVQQVRGALAMLAEPDLVAALGPGGPWRIIASHATAILHRPLTPAPHLARAEAAQAIVAWLAEKAQALERGTARVAAGDPVVAAALAWQAEGEPA